MLSNKRFDEDKRAGGERRKGSGDDLDTERRSGERRVLRYAVLFKTGIPFDELESWLAANCHDKWDMALEDMDGDLTSKTLKILFETEADRERFKASAERIRR